jgi:peptidyl-tRNA hydrolase, PTH1 family
MPHTQLIVGLGNPGQQYAPTRHNAGAWFVERVATAYSAALRAEAKFHGLFGSVDVNVQIVNTDKTTSTAQYHCKLLIPTTYMNLSGKAVQAVANFYKIPVENILVAHDELDFMEGIARLKVGGGHNGHNGLGDIIAEMQSGAFMRLRIGIGRPPKSNHNQDLAAYVLDKPSNSGKQKITDIIEQATTIVPQLLVGAIDKATNILHSFNPNTI